MAFFPSLKVIKLNLDKYPDQYARCPLIHFATVVNIPLDESPLNNCAQKNSKLLHNSMDFELWRLQLILRVLINNKTRVVKSHLCQLLFNLIKNLQQIFFSSTFSSPSMSIQSRPEGWKAPAQEQKRYRQAMQFLKSDLAACFNKNKELKNQSVENGPSDTSISQGVSVENETSNIENGTPEPGPEINHIN